MIKRFTSHPVTRVALSAFGAFCMTMTALNLGACSTVEGVGKDIQYAAEKTGEAMSGDR